MRCGDRKHTTDDRKERNIESFDSAQDRYRTPTDTIGTGKECWMIKVLRQLWGLGAEGRTFVHAQGMHEGINNSADFAWRGRGWFGINYVSETCACVISHLRILVFLWVQSWNVPNRGGIFIPDIGFEVRTLCLCNQSMVILVFERRTVIYNKWLRYILNGFGVRCFTNIKFTNCFP